MFYNKINNQLTIYNGINWIKYIVNLIMINININNIKIFNNKMDNLLTNILLNKLLNIISINIMWIFNIMNV